MIQHLRHVHHWVTGGLALGLPILFAAGLSVRDPVPLEDALTSVEEPVSARLADVLETFSRESTPDLLVYWSPAVPLGDRLPREAIFLGALRGMKFRSSAPKSGGHFLLYSLAHRRLVSSVDVKP
jgi:hypothetical protein